MEDSNQEDKQYTRNRGTNFSKMEVNALLDLIEKYKLFILNKSVTGPASQAKEIAWRKIRKELNSLDYGHVRNVESLRGKWENLKREARKYTKNVLDSSCSDMDGVSARVIAMLAEADTVGPIDAPPDIVDDEPDMNGIDDDLEKHWNEGVDSEDGDEHKEKGSRSRIIRTLNFSPQECTLLLQCVKKEKKNVFSKDCTSKAIELKNRAWSRITNNYNKLSPQKRTSKVLRCKFHNMKNMAKKVGFKNYFKDVARNRKHEKFEDDDWKDIKKEPAYEVKMDADSDDCMDNESDNDTGLKQEKPNNYVDVADDPLSSVLNGDSGIGSSHTGSLHWNYSENKEIVKLKLELLNYKLETAKLERKRLEDCILEESSTRGARATELALRMRAARLSAAAAAARFPPGHPALHYPPEEEAARGVYEHYP